MSGKKKNLIWDIKVDYIPIPENELIAWQAGLRSLLELLLAEAQLGHVDQQSQSGDQDMPLECPVLALIEPTSHVQVKLRVLPSKGS